MDDIVWKAPKDMTLKYVALYDELPPRPRGWKMLNPLEWIKYFIKKRRGEGELIAYFDLDIDGLYRSDEYPNTTMEWKDTIEIDWTDDDLG